MACIVRWRGCGGDEFHGVGSIRIVQAHYLLEIGALGDIGRRSPSNNTLELGAFVGPDA